MDPKEKQELIDSLKQKVKTAHYKVSTKVEAEKGDHKIIITSEAIEQYYQGDLVGRLKVADLNEKEIELIDDDATGAARLLLDQFVTGYKQASIKTEKTAANATQDERTYQMVTEKQLDEQKVDLHPRTDETYKNITQKQLPEHGQRPGTYDIITEAQFRDERNTFYGAPRTSGDWRDEDRNIVTEGQLDDGVNEYSEVGGATNRDEVGAKYDGGLEKQQNQIGEKQLAELLKSHKWTLPYTTTEGTDQLGKQDGELARLTAESAKEIIKESLVALGKTVLAAGITPNQLVEVVSRLVSDKSKYPVLANVISCYKNADISIINQKVATSQHFGKVANVGKNWSDELIADIFVRQIAKLAYNPIYIVQALTALANRDDLATSINDASENTLKNTNTKEASESNIFEQVLSGETEKPQVLGDASDGKYSYEGQLDEVQADVQDKDNFAKAAEEVGKIKIAEATGRNDLNLIPQNLKVNEKVGIFNIEFADASSQELSKRAEKRREKAKNAMKKESQLGGAGGMPPAAGGAGGMGNPMPPPGGADMGAPPPTESLTQPPPGEMTEETPGGGEPKPPLSGCPVCGSEDVDLDNGEWSCNNCGGEGDVYVQIRVTKWPGTIEETEAEGAKGGVGLGEEAGLSEVGLGAPETAAPGGEGTTMPNVPVGASTRITNFMLEKLASQNIKLGTVCPSCGMNNTDLVKSSHRKGSDGFCYDCGQDYHFELKAIQGKKNSVYANFTWIPKTASNCPECTRLHQAFRKSLEDYGMSWDRFKDMNMIEQANIVNKMAETNNLNLTTAMNESLPIYRYAASNRFKGTEKFDKFPSATCREKLARRFGENATSMSGPCQGKKLSDCVCSQLETLGIYTDGLAAKVASAIGSQDPMENNPIQTCVRILMDNGFNIKKACIACDGLRAAHASTDDLVIEAIAQVEPGRGLDLPGQTFRGPMDQNKRKAKPFLGSLLGGGIGGGVGSAIGGPVGGIIGGAVGGAGGEELGDLIKGDNKGLEIEQNNPLDEPISIDAEPNLDIEIEGDLGDTDDTGPELGSPDENIEGMGDEPGNLDIGLEGNVVTLLQDIAEDLMQLTQALQGKVGDNMIDNTPEDESLNVHDITENTVESPLENMEENTEESPIEEEFDIPGVADETQGGDIVKESEPKEKPCSKMMPQNRGPKHLSPQHTEETSQSDSEEKENKEAATALNNLLYSMKPKTIKKASQALDDIFEGLMKQAALAKSAKEQDIKKVQYKNSSESKIKEQPAQESKDIGKIQDGKAIGHEEPFKADKPNIPRGDSLLGDEGPEKKLDDKDRPTVPHDAPLMEGEEHFEPEQGNVVDGNQGGKKAKLQSKPIKTAQACKCKCGNPACKCNCGNPKCGNPCSGDKSKPCDKKCAETKNLVVNPGHRLYKVLTKKLADGTSNIKLTDGKTYVLSSDSKKNIVLSEKIVKNIKESQTISPRKVDTLVDDADLNATGKTHVDKPHSLAVDEKKPTEGLNQPEVPEAPNAGQLSREHTYDNKLNGPTIPAGGGMNSEYDQNTKNTPEKTDELLGKVNDLGAKAETKELAVKVAGKLLKANKISIDDLSNKIDELSKKSTSEIFDEYDKAMKIAADSRGLLEKKASNESVENIGIVQKSKPNQINLSDQISDLWTLERRNKDHEKYMAQKGDLNLFR